MRFESYKIETEIMLETQIVTNGKFELSYNARDAYLFALMIIGEGSDRGFLTGDRSWRRLTARVLRRILCGDLSYAASWKTPIA